MNEKYIFAMLQNYIKNQTVSFDTLTSIFVDNIGLSDDEFNQVKDIITKNGIKIIFDDNNDEDDTEEQVINPNNDYSDDEDYDYDLDDNQDNKEGIDIDYSIFKDTEEYKYEFKKYQSSYKNKTNEQLCVLAKAGDDRARDYLCYKNINLVRKCAMKYRKYFGHKLDVDDLIQFGNIGLMKSIEKFDPNMGTRLSTYSVFWIEQSILRGIMDFGFTVRVPVHVIEKINKVRRVNNELYKKLGREPLDVEIAEEARNFGENFTEQQVFEFKNIIKKYFTMPSLDAPIKEESEESLLDFISSENNDTPEKLYNEVCLRDELFKILNKLQEREKIIIIRRFGLITGVPETLEEIGKSLNVTRERIRQIEARTLKSLRKSEYSILLHDFVIHD